MTLREIGRIPLPEHPHDGGFDHAAVDPVSDRLYVAHTTNDAVDVIDLKERRYARSLSGLKGVAGVWVDAERRLLFTSNRGEDTVSAFQIRPTEERERFRTATGARPNGMAFDPRRQMLLVAGVGNAQRPNASPTLTFVDVERGVVRGTLVAPGRTRWATYHPPTDTFYVNIADPATILAVRANDVTRADRSFPIPAQGPHGMEQDPGGEILYCACDEGVLMTLNVRSGETARAGPLAGSPDVLWLDPELGHLYAATDELAAVDVFATRPIRHLETVPTASGAHTLTVDPHRHQVHVFLPETHEDLILEDDGR